MQYRQGNLGRVLVVKIEHGDDLNAELKNLARSENIRAGVLMAIGALKLAAVVTGPLEPVIPPEPNWRHFDDGREIIGIGTLFWDEQEPLLHLHAAIGKGDSSLMGCVRQETETYL